ncbi:hypothetical protein ACRRTK_014895 [Alexandromys fortis]
MRARRQIPFLETLRQREVPLAAGMFAIPCSAAVLRSMNWESSAPGEDIPAELCRGSRLQETGISELIYGHTNQEYK